MPQDTHEEAAAAAHLAKMDPAGVLVIGDAAHTVKANCRQLTQKSSQKPRRADPLHPLKILHRSVYSPISRSISDFAGSLGENLLYNILFIFLFPRTC